LHLNTNLLLARGATAGRRAGSTDPHLPEDVRHFVDYPVDFFVCVVEVRGDADPGLRAIVHQDISTQQLGQDFRAARHDKRHGAAAFLFGLGGVNSPTPLARLLDQPAR